MKSFIIINEKDNVGVAIEELEKGLKISEDIIISELIPFGHKFALKDIKAGEDILKYGQVIGSAKKDIKKGQNVHTEEISTKLDDIISYEYKPKEVHEKLYNDKRYFYGYEREDGTVGTRNDIWIIPTVGCVNATARKIAEVSKEMNFEGIDDIVPVTHNMGCSQLGKDQETTQKILAGIAKNPNAGGVLILSLGCENNNLEKFLPYLGEYDKERIKFLVTQDQEDELEVALEKVKELVLNAQKYKRKKCGFDKLTIGFKCGGSDAFSGITANPLCGRISDRIVYYGGNTILTEVPEMFGAEKLLMERAKNKEIFYDTVDLINNYKQYFKKYNQTIYENPSPGNKKGGISTLEEKSLGCIQKGGESYVSGVLDYGEKVENKGLNLLNGSGNDQVSCTNLIASGCNLIIFTTGRGNPFGTLVPTIKVSSNSVLANKKKNWIDFDAGSIVYNKSFDEVEVELENFIENVASGRVITKNEMYNYKEISIFRDGVIL